MLTNYTAEDISEETLIAHPELRGLVEEWGKGRRVPTAIEALLLNVIVRQQRVLSEMATVIAVDLIRHGPRRANVVA